MAWIFQRLSHWKRNIDAGVPQRFKVEVKMERKQCEPLQAGLPVCRRGLDSGYSK